MDFDKMTVLELRKVAKDMNVKLGAGISKQGIVDKLNAIMALNKQEEAPAQEAQPVRHASIITDDEFEDSDSTEYTSPPRPAVVRPGAGNGGTSSLSTISAKAPAFTMEGSRAWHNPRAYAGNYSRPAGSRPAAPEQRPQNPYPAAPRANMPQQSRPQQPRPTYQRFGPENDPPAYGARQEYAAPRQEYAQPSQRSDFGAYRSDYAAPQQPVQKEMSPSEILMTGELGDCQGILEVLPDGFGFLRMGGLLPGKGDVYVSNVQVKRYGLRTGDYLTGKTHPQRENDKNNALLYITEVNGGEPEEKSARPAFDELTAVYPRKKLHLSARRGEDVFLAGMDLVTPMALGQRALLSVSPDVEGNQLLCRLSQACASAAPKAVLMTLLLDEKPEEVTEIKEQIKGDTYAATFDLSAEMVVKTAEMVLEMAQRQAEQKKDVILLVNSLTKLAKACNAAAPQQNRLLPNGLVSGGLVRAKKFLAAARNIREGGSLTIIALQEIRTKTPIDDVIAAEMENTCNLQVEILRGEGEVPFLPDGGTASSRRPELVLTPEEMAATQQARVALSGKSVQEQLSLLRSLVQAP